MGPDTENERVRDLVRAVVDEYVADPGVEHGQITSVDDLYDAGSGLPR